MSDSLTFLADRVMTVSRCFRAETSSVEEERGIYRVHQFTKVQYINVLLPYSNEFCLFLLINYFINTLITVVCHNL